MIVKIYLIGFWISIKVERFQSTKWLTQIIKQISKEVRAAIAPIVDIVKLCAHQNIWLWGHSESAKNQPQLGESDLTNAGNFIELLNYRIRGGDKLYHKALENHIWLSKMPSTPPEKFKKI